MRRIRDGLVILLLGLLLLHALDWLAGRLWPSGLGALAERGDLPAYANEPYDVEQLLDEQLRANDIYVRRRTLAFTKPFSGDLFNVERIGASTYRRTTNPGSLETASPLVLMLGGSTVLCSEVPDAYTLPSLLSEDLNRYAGGRAHVLNAGMNAADSNRDLQRLRWELDKGLVPDVVVQLAGVNDVFQGMYRDRPNGPIPLGALLGGFARARSAQRDGETPSAGPSLSEIVSWLVPTRVYAAARRHFAERRIPDPPAHLADPEDRRALAERTRATFLRNVRAEQDLADEHGFQLHVFLQPHVFAGNFTPPTEDVEGAIDDAARRLPLLREAFEIGYPLLQDAIGELRAEGVDAVDLTQALSRKRDPVFVDFCHVTSPGNRILAEAIGAHLRSAGP